MLFTKKINASINDRAHPALSRLKQSAYALNILRSRVESRVNFILDDKGKTDSCQELTSLLELVEKGELILNVISQRMSQPATLINL